VRVKGVSEPHNIRYASRVPRECIRRVRIVHDAERSISEDGVSNQVKETWETSST
jgi:hypothetical protein